MNSNKAKFEIGDKAKIVNYGHLIWSKKSLTNGKYYGEFCGIHMYDIKPEYVGQEVIIKDVIETQGNYKYSTTLFSWANEDQLELISKNVNKLNDI